MNKPVSITKEEFTDKIVLLINECELPPILIEPVLENCLRQIRAINSAQLEKDKVEWSKYLKDSTASDENVEYAEESIQE